MRTSLIDTDLKHKTTPLHPVTDQPALLTMSAKCLDIAAELELAKRAQQDSVGFGTLLTDCWSAYNSQYLTTLGATYWAADIDWVTNSLTATSTIDEIEPMFVYSHNVRIRAYVADQLAELTRVRDEVRRELARQQQYEIHEASLQREAEIAESKRRFAAAMSAFAQGMAAASQPPQAVSQQPAVYAQQSRSCISDYSCGYGYTCVKENYSGSGYCAQAVNRYGTPTYQLPSMDSVFVKMPSGADCKFVTDCPPSFRCDARSGACLK